MAEISTEFKVPNKWQKYLYGGFLPLLITVCVILYLDNRQCRNARVKDANEIRDKVLNQALAIANQKKEEIITSIQPQIDQQKIETENMQNTIDSLSKPKHVK